MTQTDIKESTIEQIETAPVEETKSPNIRHIVNPASNLDFQAKYGRVESAQELVDVARVRGIEIRALCGEKWIPTKDASLIKNTCSKCMDIMGGILNDGE